MVDADLQDLIDLRQCQDVIQRLRQENDPGFLGRGSSSRYPEREVSRLIVMPIGLKAEEALRC